VVLFGLAQTAFLVPWAVLAVPLSTPTFPILARAAATDDHAGFDTTLGRTLRAMVLTAGLGVGVLVGTALPAGRLLSAVTKSHPSPGLLTAAIVAFAPGLLGYSLFALVNRAFSALGQARYAAIAAVAGWASTIVCAFALAAALPRPDRIVALAAANSLGMGVLAVALYRVVRLRRGGSALTGFGRTLLVSSAAAAGSAATGWLAGWAVTTVAPGIVGAGAGGLFAVAASAATFLAVGYAIDRDDVRPVVAAAVGRLRGPGRPGLR
jgi:putative peptidoglycan lipid II flippase